jgi:hypothetical protein
MIEDRDTAWHRNRGPQPLLDATVICTPTVLNPVTKACLEQYAPYASIKPITPDSKYGMWHHIVQYWNIERPLVHVDHDMVFVYDNLAGLVECPEPWCICPAWSLGEHVTIGLGLVKFSSHLRQSVSCESIRHQMDTCWQCHGMWWHVEHHIGHAFLAAGFKPHQHEDVLHDHTDLLKKYRVSQHVSVAVPAGGVTYVRDYYE